MDEITKEDFDQYTLVQNSCKYNMEIDSFNAAVEAGLDLDTFLFIHDNYDELEQKFYGG